MAVVFAIESLRLCLKNQNPLADAGLGQLRDRLTQMLKPIRKAILGDDYN
jgi:hypothetical protein